MYSYFEQIIFRGVGAQHPCPIVSPPPFRSFDFSATSSLPSSGSKQPHGGRRRWRGRRWRGTSPRTNTITNTNTNNDTNTNTNNDTNTNTLKRFSPCSACPAARASPSRPPPSTPPSGISPPAQGGRARAPSEGSHSSRRCRWSEERPGRGLQRSRCWPCNK